MASVPSHCEVDEDVGDLPVDILVDAAGSVVESFRAQLVRLLGQAVADIVPLEVALGGVRDVEQDHVEGSAVVEEGKDGVEELADAGEGRVLFGLPRAVDEGHEEAVEGGDEEKEELEDLSMVQVELTYKGGAKHITTRFPSVELSLVSVGIFDTDIEILLEAIDKKGNVVGEAKRGGRVDTGSGTVTMKGLEKLNVIMSMNIDFHGKFSFSAFDPRTMTKHASISMETDYAV